MSALPTFEDCLANAGDQPHLFLGNGFSIGWNADTFSYGNLRDRADFAALSCPADELFEVLGTADFEIVIDRLDSVDAIASIYEPDCEIADRAEQDAAVIRDALAGVLAASHPDNVGRVDPDAYASVRGFLAHFGSVYTVNYDLLLYWALMQDPADGHDVPMGDGFRADLDDPDAPWVTWDMAKSWSQQIHYLHGALHLFDAGDRLKKLTWIRTDEPVIDQIRAQLTQRV